MGRTAAINLFKRYISHYLIDRNSLENDSFEGLEALYKKRVKPNPNPGSWVIVHGMIRKGKYFYRNDNCLWVEALVDYPDNEIKYYVCCYGDYQAAKSYNNENIILTMEHTIAQGDLYCSRVLHDTRIDWDLRHPSKKFWDNIEFEDALRE